jgi:AraC-like DNA-binding protein
MAVLDKRVPPGATGRKVQSPVVKSAIPESPQTRQGEMPPLVHERRLRRAMEMIELQLPHSVRELARELHLSPTHLQRLFKQETGVQIGRLLTERRLHKAAELLSTTEMEIKEIAYCVGYGHHSSFVRAFQRRFRQSPKQYRQERVA